LRKGASCFLVHVVGSSVLGATLENDQYPTLEAHTLTPEVMQATHGTIAPWMASLTFGGPDLQTVYLGSLRGTTIPYFRSPVAGLPMQHWQ
jgi:hypothetical protein